MNTYGRAVYTDRHFPHVTTVNREMTRIISVSQFGSGAWLDINPDGTWGTKIEDGPFEVAGQRRAGLDIAVAKPSLDVLEAAGVTVDRRGDDLANGGEYNRRHNGCLNAVRDMMSAVAIGQIVQGDKEQPEKTRHLNDGHVIDLAEVGGCPETGVDTIVEGKVPSLHKKKHTKGGGGTVRYVGHRVAFGSTEEEYRLMVLGCRRRGRPQDKPFDPETGRGFAQAVKGQMHDALKNKRSNVVTFIVESTAAITPRARKYCYELKGRTEGRGATDRTKYGRNRNSPTNFIPHHVQRISKAVVMYDSLGICSQVTVKKRQAYDMASPAPAAAAAAAEGTQA